VVGVVVGGGVVCVSFVPENQMLLEKEEKEAQESV